MLGAILGDIVGSPYEFDHNNYKHKDFPLLSEKSHFTDDTVMTAAVAVGLIDGKGLPERTFCAVQHEMRLWGRKYPHAGYGGMFRRNRHEGMFLPKCASCSLFFQMFSPGCLYLQSIPVPPQRS